MHGYTPQHDAADGFSFSCLEENMTRSRRRRQVRNAARLGRRKRSRKAQDDTARAALSAAVCRWRSKLPSCHPVPQQPAQAPPPLSLPARRRARGRQTRLRAQRSTLRAARHRLHAVRSPQTATAGSPGAGAAGALAHARGRRLDHRAHMHVRSVPTTRRDADASATR